MKSALRLSLFSALSAFFSGHAVAQGAACEYFKAQEAEMDRMIVALKKELSLQKQERKSAIEDVVGRGMDLEREFDDQYQDHSENEMDYGFGAAMRRNDITDDKQMSYEERKLNDYVLEIRDKEIQDEQEQYIKQLTAQRRAFRREHKECF